VASRTPVKAFLDTNVLLYLLSGDERKADAAEALIGAGGCISVQVLNEFAAVASRKLALPWDEIVDILAGVRANCTVLPLTEATHDRAREIAAGYRFSFYDASIVASALEAGCTLLHTEDLQHGQTVERTLAINNPFRQAVPA